MSDKFKKDIDDLYDKGKLSDFEYSQLVCWNSIDDKLEFISKGSREKISVEEGTKNVEETEKISESTKNQKKKVKKSNSFSHNLYSIVKEIYSQYGCITMSIKLIEQKAKKKGLKLPNDPGSTLRSVGKPTKHLFFYDPEGKGYQLTELGENFLQEKFNVSRGTEELPKELEE